MRALGVAAWIACLGSTVGCEGRSVSVLGAGPSTFSPSDAGGGPTCSGARANFCASIPRSTDARAIDGVGDEFCQAPSMNFRVDDAPWKRGVGQFPQSVTLVATWSVDGMHMHVHVVDPVVITGPDDNLSMGDGVEFYLAGTSELHGPINGEDDGGAVQVIVTPPGSGHPPRATTYLHPSKGVQTSAPFDPSRFAARIVSDGYEVEILIPWTGTVPTLGAAIGFDVAIDVADTDVATGRELQAAIGYRFPVGPTNCTSDVGPQPFCDNQTWCTPHLEEEPKANDAR